MADRNFGRKIGEALGVAGVKGKKKSDSKTEVEQLKADLEEAKKRLAEAEGKAKEEPKDEPKAKPADDKKSESKESKPAPNSQPAPEPDTTPSPKAPVLRPAIATDVVAQKGRDEMRDLSFYEVIGNEIYDYDRGLTMGDQLKGWMKSAYPDDFDLSQDFIVRILPEILKKNPDLIPSVKEAIRKSQDSAMPYSIRWAEYGNHSHTFGSYKEASAWEHDTYAGKSSNFEKNSYLQKLFIKKNPDGTEVEVSLDEIVAYYNSYEGDKEAFCRKLELKPPKQNQDKPDKGKSEGKPKSGKGKGNNGSKGSNKSNKDNEAS